MTDTITLRKLAEAATQGKWKVAKPRISFMNKQKMFSVSGPTHVQDWEDYGLVKQDADYIAAANPKAIIALLDEIDSLRAALAQTEAEKTAYALVMSCL